MLKRCKPPLAGGLLSAPGNRWHFLWPGSNGRADKKCAFTGQIKTKEGNGFEETDQCRNDGF